MSQTISERVISQPGFGAGPGAEVGAATQTGAFMGEMVEVEKSPQSLLADAAEELTFGASEEVERTLAERKETAKKESRSLEAVMMYIKDAEDLGNGEADKFAKQLTAMMRNGLGGILRFTENRFSDDTSAHAALSYALATVDESSLGPEELAEFRDLVSQALDKLESERGRAIRAGYNIAGVDSSDLATPKSSLRVLYRDTTIDFSSYESTFRNMLAKFGPEEFPKAVQFLIRALGADMKAQEPSADAASLKEVMDGLYMVESLGTIYGDAGNLLASLVKRHGGRELDPRQIIEPLLRYKDESMLLASKVRMDMPFLLSSQPVHDAELTQGVRELARKMPHKLFASPESRQNLLLVLQELNDDAVAREEAMEEA